MLQNLTDVHTNVPNPNVHKFVKTVGSNYGNGMEQKMAILESKMDAFYTEQTRQIADAIHSIKSLSRDMKQFSDKCN